MGGFGVAQGGGMVAATVVSNDSEGVVARAPDVLMSLARSRRAPHAASLSTSATNAAPVLIPVAAAPAVVRRFEPWATA